MFPQYGTMTTVMVSPPDNRGSWDRHYNIAHSLPFYVHAQVGLVLAYELSKSVLRADDASVNIASVITIALHH